MSIPSVKPTSPRQPTVHIQADVEQKDGSNNNLSTIIQEQVELVNKNEKSFADAFAEVLESETQKINANNYVNVMTYIRRKKQDIFNEFMKLLPNDFNNFIKADLSGLNLTESVILFEANLTGANLAFAV